MNKQSKDATAWLLQTSLYTGLLLTMVAATAVIVVGSCIKQTIFDR
jgi:hypothetical protein